MNIILADRVFGMGLFKRLFSEKEKYVTYEKVYNPPRQHMRILKDSLDIMVKTTNPSTYFSRFKLACEEAMYCEDEPDAVWNGMTCREIYELLSDREYRDVIHRKFIDRLFAAGKEDNLTYQMHEVGYSMSQDTVDYFVKRLNGKQYHFCKIRFDHGGKLYTYITKNRSLKAGDSVTVTTGYPPYAETKLKQAVEVFDAPLTKLDFLVQDLRCTDETLTNITCPNCGASIEVDVNQKTGLCQYCKTNFYLLR